MKPLFLGIVVVVMVAGACGKSPGQADKQGPMALRGDAGEEVPGGRIVFVSDRDTTRGYNLDIYSMNADGSGQTRLTDNPGHEHQPAWSPDGATLSFAGGSGSQSTGIYLMSTDGSRATALTEGWRHIGVARWSPTGDQIAVAGDRGEGNEIYVVDVEDGDVTRLTDEPVPPEVGGAYQPDWSPDGDSIVHERVRVEGEGDTSARLYVMRADGSHNELLATGASTESAPRWSRQTGVASHSPPAVTVRPRSTS